MPLILKRILSNGLLTAALLAVIGYGYAELAGVFLLANPPARTITGNVPAAPAEDPLSTELTYRLPAMMALWGFLFIAAGEGVMYAWRRRRPIAVPAKPAESKADTAEVLLEQILAQVETAKTAPSPSPSATPAENSPVA
jgi:hypothetical protein